MLKLFAVGVREFSTRDEDAHERIDHRDHGRLAEPGDARGFVAGAVALAEAPELRASLHLAARARVNSLAWRAIVDNLVEIQRRVILSAPILARR